MVFRVYIFVKLVRIFIFFVVSIFKVVGSLIRGGGVGSREVFLG